MITSSLRMLARSPGAKGVLRRLLGLREVPKPPSWRSGAAWFELADGRSSTWAGGAASPREEAGRVTLAFGTELEALGPDCTARIAW